MANGTRNSTIITMKPMMPSGRRRTTGSAGPPARSRPITRNGLAISEPMTTRNRQSDQKPGPWSRKRRSATNSSAPVPTSHAPTRQRRTAEVAPGRTAYGTASLSFFASSFETRWIPSDPSTRQPFCLSEAEVGARALRVRDQQQHHAEANEVEDRLHARASFCARRGSCNRDDRRRGAAAVGIVSRVSTSRPTIRRRSRPKDYIKKPDGPADLRIDCGVAIVGGGPAGMACAVRLGQLLGEDPATLEKLGEVPLIVLEKGRAPGAHELSGAIVNPSALQRAVPRHPARPDDLVRAGHRRGRLLHDARPGPAPADAAAVPQQGQLDLLAVAPDPLDGRAGRGARRVRAARDDGAAAAGRRGAVRGVQTAPMGLDRAGNAPPAPRRRPRSSHRRRCWPRARRAISGASRSTTSRSARASRRPTRSASRRSGRSQSPSTGSSTRSAGRCAASQVRRGRWLVHLPDGPGAHLRRLRRRARVRDSGLSPHDVLQEFKTHPFVRRLLEGASASRGARRRFRPAASTRFPTRSPCPARC